MRTCDTKLSADNYVLGQCKDKVFLRLQELLEPFSITKFYTDGWGAYEHHLDPEKHRVGKDKTQKIESKLLFQDGTRAWPGNRVLHQSL